MEYATTPKEVRAAFSRGKIASMLGIEGLFWNLALANLDFMEPVHPLAQFVCYTNLAHGTLLSPIIAIIPSQRLARLLPMGAQTAV